MENKMGIKEIRKNFFFSFVLLSITTSSSIAQSVSWISKTNMPTARTFSCACVVDDKFFVIGGTSAASAKSDVELYNPATDTWEKKANMPVARCYSVACALNGKIYVFGGTSGCRSSTEFGLIG